MGTCSSRTSCCFCDSSYSHRGLARSHLSPSGATDSGQRSCLLRAPRPPSFASRISGHASGMAIHADSSSSPSQEARANQARQAMDGEADGLGLRRAPKSERPFVVTCVERAACCPDISSVAGESISSGKAWSAAFHGGRKRRVFISKATEAWSWRAFKRRWMLHNRR